MINKETAKKFELLINNHLNNKVYYGGIETTILPIIKFIESDRVYYFSIDSIIELLKKRKLYIYV